MQKKKVIFKLRGYTPPVDLWTSEDVALWKEALAKSTAERIPSFAERPYTAEDHVALLEWKMKRGVWHGALMKYAKALTEDEVQAAADAARKETDWKRKVKAICVLKGTGVALGSAFLSAEDPQAYPFMSDGLLARVMGADYVPKYTLGEYEKVLEAVREKQRALDGALSCAEIEQALHS